MWPLIGNTVRALPTHAPMVGMPGGDDKICLLYHCQGHTCLQSSGAYLLLRLFCVGKHEVVGEEEASGVSTATLKLTMLVMLILIFYAERGIVTCKGDQSLYDRQHRIAGEDCCCHGGRCCSH